VLLWDFVSRFRGIYSRWLVFRVIIPGKRAPLLVAANLLWGLALRVSFGKMVYFVRAGRPYHRGGRATGETAMLCCGFRNPRITIRGYCEVATESQEFCKSSVNNAMFGFRNICV